MAYGILLPISQSPVIADATLFKRWSYVSEAITALGNRAVGETYVDFVVGKISGKSRRAGLDMEGGLDLRKGYVGAWRASRKHEPSPCRRDPLRSRRNAGAAAMMGVFRPRLVPRVRWPSASAPLSRRSLAGARKFEKNEGRMCGTKGGSERGHGI